ncbi:unnamed protein product [Rotaria sp. Silwood2]|nr:unnamed protein product [Rotaria sp. Silwood2]CAF2932062.1 unnamed protein product [Rotaria sp. Silwood2]CAF3186832.1 unnamed protein product [Rotaria sp. Silwood2]CAF3336998.1 unnamed protein product [Rotaria sp. Silwood2]CAF4057036.1 unnamed protein product [Rotaria sp. Silwood2]
MTSFDFNFAEPTASYNNSVDTTMDAHIENIDSIQKSDFVVLKGHPVKLIEITHCKRGKTGRPKVFLVGIDIFTGDRYEEIRLAADTIQVPHVIKKDYLVADITNDNFLTLFNEDPYEFHSEIKLNKVSDITGSLIDKFKEDIGQIKVTVLKALGEEQIIAFNVIE